MAVPGMDLLLVPPSPSSGGNGRRRGADLCHRQAGGRFKRWGRPPTSRRPFLLGARPNENTEHKGPNTRRSHKLAREWLWRPPPAVSGDRQRVGSAPEQAPRGGPGCCGGRPGKRERATLDFSRMKRAAPPRGGGGGALLG